ncbi:MAG: hypothetical protein ACK528_06055, partial [Alphaproteobacteria bacterium]
MLDGQPTISAVAMIGMDREAQLVDLEIQRLVLIVNLEPQASDTLIMASPSCLRLVSRRPPGDGKRVRSGPCG